MVEYQPQHGSGGRHCLLTEDNCRLKVCQRGCYGMHAAESLKKLPQTGNMAYLGRALNSAIGHLPGDKQEAIVQYINEGRRLTPFEDFLKDQEE